MSRLVKTALISLVSFSIVLLAPEVSSATAALDPTFGSDGKIILPRISANDVVRRVLVQPDGKIVLFGSTTGLGYFVIRTNPDGSPDPSFGNGGIVLIAGSFSLTDIALKPAGGMVLTGLFTTIFNTEDAVVYDVTAGGTGSFRNTTTWNDCPGRRILVRPDGRLIIVALCSEGAPPGQKRLAVITYTASGDLDTTFGQGGISRTTTNVFPDLQELSPDAIFESLGDPVLQPDGKIVTFSFGENAAEGFATRVTRFNANGSIDSAFGFRAFSFGGSEYPTGTLIQPDGKILANGVTSYIGGVDGSYIIRFNPNGTSDNSFGQTGSVGIYEPDPYSRGLASALAVQQDRKILTAGMRDGVYALSRYEENGSIDNSFGIDGILKIPMGSNPGRDTIFSVAWQGSTKLIAAGRVRDDSGGYRVGLIRLNLGVRTTPFDFDGDGKADRSVFRPSDRIWYVDQSSDGFRASRFGLPNDKIVPADYDGDGKADIAIYRDGIWWRVNSSNGTVSVNSFGLPDDIPQPADYTGDGRAEFCIYRNGSWWSIDLTNNQVQVVQFGGPGRIPAAGDYDGDGRYDQAYFEPNDGFYYNRSSQGFGFVQLTDSGGAGVVVPGDYDGDGKTDVAVVQPSTPLTWEVYPSNPTRAPYEFRWGLPSDVLVPADYDGDGKTDPAIYRAGAWWVNGSTNGVSISGFGLEGDIPIPSVYVR